MIGTVLSVVGVPAVVMGVEPDVVVDEVVVGEVVVGEVVLDGDGVVTAVEVDVELLVVELLDDATEPP